MQNLDVVDEVVDAVLFTCCNPYFKSKSEAGVEATEMREFRYQLREWNETEDMMIIWWLVWGEAAATKVKTECSKLTLPYEATMVQYIWWAQPIKIDPLLNISQNRVPPPQHMVVEGQSAKLLWIGTSISDQSTDTVKVGRENKIEITKAKIFTILGDGKIKPHLNLKDKAKSLVEDQGYRYIIIETGVNDITNIPAKMAKSVLEEKIQVLKSVVQSLSRPGMEIILVKPVLRIDSEQKEAMSQWFGRRLESMFKNTPGFGVESLGITARNKWERMAIYGERDGIHLAGEQGSWWATHRAVLLVKRVLQRGLTGETPWWSAASETRSQAEIDEVNVCNLFGFKFISK